MGRFVHIPYTSRDVHIKIHIITTFMLFVKRLFQVKIIAGQTSKNFSDFRNSEKVLIYNYSFIF